MLGARSVLFNASVVSRSSSALARRPTLVWLALHRNYAAPFSTTGLTGVQQSCRQRAYLEKFPSQVRARFFFATSATRKVEDAPPKPPTSKKPPDHWDLNGLKREARRNADRAMKKVGKATTKLRNAREASAALMDDEDASLEELEKCPDVVAIEADLQQLRVRALALNKLADALDEVKSNADNRFADIVDTAIELGVNDVTPPRAPRGTKKPKGKPSKPRKPYFTYTSADGVDIRVGRRAEDNDELSCNPEHRDNADWW